MVCLMEHLILLMLILYPKPNIDPYKKIIEKFNLDPKKSILIEDIAHNLEQAKNLGMKTCWLENDEIFCKKRC